MWRPDLQNFAKIIIPDLKVQSISIIDSYQELIQDYDNNYHQLLNQRKYTFGKFYQKGGKTTEQESLPMLNTVINFITFYNFLEVLSQGQNMTISTYFNMFIVF